MSDLFGLLLPCKEEGTDKGKKRNKIEINPVAKNRLFTYVAAIADKATINRGDAAQYAYVLSRRYTSDYDINPAQIDEALYTPFSNVVHSSTLEGGAVVTFVDIEKDKDKVKTKEFLHQFTNDAVPNAYWPLLQLAYNEYLTLLRMSQDVYFHGDIKNPSKQEHRNMENYKESLLLFRMNYRFSHASNITMHNQVFNNWRKAFSSEDILKEVTQDVEEVESYLSDYLQKKAHAKLEIGSILIGVIVLLSGVFGANFKELNNISLMDARVYGSITAVFIGALIYGVLRYRRFIKK